MSYFGKSSPDHSTKHLRKYIWNKKDQLHSSHKVHTHRHSWIKVTPTKESTTQSKSHLNPQSKL